MKYTSTEIVFREIPNEVTLAINISNCPYHCEGCHSPYLREDVGEYLDEFELDELITNNKGITCVCFMGGDSDPTMINRLAKYVKLNFPELLVGWYSGTSDISDEIDLYNFNYIKIGSYIKELGPLDSPTTNQQFFEVQMAREIDSNGNPIYGIIDMTSLFWEKNFKQ